MPASSQPVSREIVHRAIDNEVFVGSFSEVSPHEFFTDISIPANHSKIPRDAKYLPTILALEAIRQAIFVTCHKGLKIPMGWHFVTKRSGLTWHRRARLPQGEPFVCGMAVKVAGIRTVKGMPRDLNFELELSQSDTLLASGKLTAFALTPESYHVLRREALALAPTPRNTTHESTRSADFTVEWDDNNQFFFRRLGDHVVSMVLMDALISAATTETDSDEEISEVDVAFSRFAERDSPIHIELRQPCDDKRTIYGVLIQNKEPIAEGRVLRDASSALHRFSR